MRTGNLQGNMSGGFYCGKAINGINGASASVFMRIGSRGFVLQKRRFHEIPVRVVKEQASDAPVSQGQSSVRDGIRERTGEWIVGVGPEIWVRTAVKWLEVDTVKYKVVLIPSEDGFSVGCPSLPGCWSQGATEEEALGNIAEAIQEYLAAGETELDPTAQLREVEVPA